MISISSIIIIIMYTIIIIIINAIIIIIIMIICDVTSHCAISWSRAADGLRPLSSSDLILHTKHIIVLIIIVIVYD